MKIFKQILALLIITTFSLAQEWEYSNRHLFYVGQKDVQLGDIKLINSGNVPWKNNTIIKVVLPDMFSGEWIIDEAALSIKKPAGRRFTNRPTKSVKLIVNKETLKIANLPNIYQGEVLVIKGLKLGSFKNECHYGSLSIIINDKPGTQIKHVDKLAKIISLSNASLYIPSSIIDGLAEDFAYDAKVMQFIKPDGLMAIGSIKSSIADSIVVPIGAEKLRMPQVKVSNGAIHRLRPVNRILAIEMPFNIDQNSSQISITPNKYMDNYDIRNNQLLIKLRRRGINKNDDITIDGIMLNPKYEKYERFKQQAAIDIAWTNLHRNDRITLTSQNQIQFGQVEYQQSGDAEMVANSGSIFIPNIRIDDDAMYAVLQENSYIDLSIPDNILAYWDPSILKALIGGSAASKVNNKVDLLSKKKVRIHISESFQPNDYFSIGNLEIYAERRTEKDFKQGKLLESHLEIKINNKGNHLKGTFKNTIQIVEIDIALDGNQVILEHDDYQELQPVHFSLESKFTAFKPGDRLRLELDDNLNARWNIGIDESVISGSATGKIDSKIRYDSQYPDAIIFNVIGNLGGTENFTIKGLALEQISTRSQSPIYLYLNDSDQPIATTTNLIKVNSPIFTMLDDQIIFLEDEKTELFAFELNPNGLLDYFGSGQHFDIIIPESSPIYFSKLSTPRIDMHIENKVQYIDSKKARFTINSQVPADYNLRIAGMNLAEATSFSAGMDTFLLSVDDKSAVRCSKSYEIVSKKSKYKRSAYYFKLIKSNMRKGENIKLELDGNLKWDRSKIDLHFNPITAQGMLDFRNPVYSPGNKSMTLKITESFGEEDVFRLSGLYVTYDQIFTDAYLYLDYENYFGPQQSILRYPISFRGREPVLPRVIPRFLMESYTKPLISLVGELSGNTSESQLLKSMNATGKYFQLPEIVIQNGMLTPADNSIFKEYVSYLSNLDSKIKKKEYNVAEQYADRLLRISPQTWVGYYKKSEILLKQSERLTESRELYQKAISLGYIASEKYPVLFDDDINSQAGKYIVEAKSLINNHDYVNAEKRLYTVLAMPDSLNPVYKGNANYLLGLISLKLNDCSWAARFFRNAEQIGVSDQTTYNITEAKSEYSKCQQRNSLDNIDSSSVAILPPELVISPNNASSLVQLNSNLNYPNAIKMQNTLLLEKPRSNQNDKYILSENNIYRISARPLRSQILAFSTAICLGGLLIGLTI